MYVNAMMFIRSFAKTLQLVSSYFQYKIRKPDLQNSHLEWFILRSIGLRLVEIQNN